MPDQSNKVPNWFSKGPDWASKGAQSVQVRCPISTAEVHNLLNKVTDQFSQVPNQSSKVMIC